MLSPAGSFALEQRDDRVSGGLSPRVERRLRHGAHRQRRAVRVALQVDQPAGSFHRHLRRRRVSHRSPEAERRHRDMDQVREIPRQILGPTPEFRASETPNAPVRARRLDEHVRVA